jgi:hypothetical protein
MYMVKRGSSRELLHIPPHSSGDNLGSQLLGGFKEGSQAHRKCRECMGLAEKIQTKIQYKVEI